MSKLCIGVSNVMYGFGDEPDKTTFDVALELESEYLLFSTFWRMYKKEICNEVGEMFAYQIINRIKHGAPEFEGEKLLGRTMKNFNIYLENEEMRGAPGVRGVPTLAAKKGYNSRLKTFGPRRPSFIDSGTLKTHFMAWIKSD